jgi:16S rRNA (guanine527-N7)-methyltransferase
MERSALERLLEAGGVQTEHIGRLAEYGAVLLESNRRTNLTGAKTPEALADHILDSLTLAPYVASPLVDIGSGGGLPAIPLAIVAGVEITLVEATGKKARFLSAALEQLGLDGAVIPQRAEAAARLPELRDRFACGTARAVSSGTTTAELVLPFLRPGGLAMLQRGTMSPGERNALADAALVLNAELEGITPVGPGREIALLRKKGLTPQRFPRRTGIPAQRPLCTNVSRET